ncbi:MAG: peptide ABC transporter permease, partial [Pseudothermotoga sp.]
MKKKIEQLQDNAVIPIGTYWQLVRKRFLKHRLALVGLIILVFVALFSFFG